MLGLGGIAIPLDLVRWRRKRPTRRQILAAQHATLRREREAPEARLADARRRGDKAGMGRAQRAVARATRRLLRCELALAAEAGR